MKIKIQSLNYLQSKTYLVALGFVAANVILPQLLHAIPMAGAKLLPIFFFTLVGAYKFGWRAGLLVAVFSPMISHLITGMPYVEVLPVIMIKSIILALTAGLTAKNVEKHTMLTMLFVVAVSQILGSVAQYCFCMDFSVVSSTVIMSLPGIALQVLGGYAVVKYLIK